ncbi:prenyltransferase [candidate division WOR-3 bacterium]|uniref:Prenyltransferase n=1 Tax=candidate division WOR-3 bacterium TaxID=2052148 RepID=A0A938BTX2_UNCW3|nr:prenyltransferase [candidate division WOR-3 bacterium]
MHSASRPAVWLRALRAPFFVGTLVPAAFGAAYARFAGYPFSWGLFWLTMIGTALANAGCNLANDYFDYRSGDDQLTQATPFSGGSKVIQDGLLSPRQVRNASITSLVLCAAIGLYLNVRTGGSVLLVVGVIGLVIAWFYTAPPLRLGSRSGLGEIVCVLGCGPVVAFGAYFVQARALSLPALIASLPIGLLMGLVLFINEFQDVEADGAVGKRTLVVVMGTRAASRLLSTTLLVTYGLIGVLVLTGVLAPASLLALLTVPVALFAAIRAHRFHADRPRLLPANAAIILTHLATGVFMTLAAWL